MGVLYISRAWYTLNLIYFPLFFVIIVCIQSYYFPNSFLELKTRFPKLHGVNIGLLIVWGVFDSAYTIHKLP